MYFWNYGLPKMWLYSYPKSPVSEHCSTANIIMGPKYCWNLHQHTFIIFSHHSYGNGVGKCLSQWYLKSLDCLLTHWLTMTSILFVKVTIYCNQFKCIYLSNIKTFPDICSTLFLKSKSNFEHFEKRMTLIAYVFPKFGISKDVVR